MSEISKLNGYDIKDKISRDGFNNIGDITPLYFTSLDDLINSDKLKVGNIVYLNNNEGNSLYKISDSINSDIYQIELSNGLYADEIIDEDVKIHLPYRIQNAGNTSIIQIGNCNMIIDLGISDAYDYLVNYLIDNDITEFKYLMITHYDPDHISSIENFKRLINNDNFDFSNCTFLLPHQNIDWTELSDYSIQHQAENEIIAFLELKNLTIKYPSEEEKIYINKNNFLKFYNCDSNYYSDYYEITESDYKYNAFSMMCELNTFGKSILFTGDANIYTENNIVDEIEKIDVILLPHHGLNLTANEEMLHKSIGATGIILNTTTTQPLRPYYQIIQKSSGKIYTLNENGSIDITINNKGITIDSEYSTISPNTNIILKANDDLDDFIKEGTYICNSETIGATLQNTPYGYSNQFKMQVIQITSSIVYQILYTLNVDSVIYIRKLTPNTLWNQWKKVYLNNFGYLRAYYDGTYQTKTGNAFVDINLDTVDTSLGNNLTLSEGKIVIGKGISLVEVNANINMYGLGTGDRIMGAITVNNSVAVRGDTVASDRGNFGLHCIIPVSEGDKIFIQSRNMNTSSYYVEGGIYSTSLTVKVIN